MERGIGQTWYRGEVATLLGWLEKLPEKAMRRRPLLLIWFAAAMMLAGRFDGVESLLEEADLVLGNGSGAETIPGSNEDAPHHLLATAASVRSMYSRLQGDPHGAVEHARRALDLLPEDNLNPRPFAAIALAQAHEAADNGEAAITAFAKAGTLGRAAGHDYVALSAMAAHARLELAQGHLREADDVLQRALGYATEHGSEQLPAVGSVRIGRGELLYEWNDLDAAARHLTEGIELATRTGDVEILMWGHVAISQVRQALGDAEGALAAARQAETVARSSDTEHAILDAAVRKTRLYLKMGDLASASSEQERAASVGEGRPYSRDSRRIILARLLIARNEPGEALRLLAQLHATARTPARAIEILALQALALHAEGQKEEAASTLAEALALAEPEGYVRTFVDESPPMAEILSGVLETQRRGHLYSTGRVPSHYLRKLLTALEQDSAPAASPTAGLPEPVSERELEMLALIAAGKSNRQIASELFVSVGTVKTHLNNLYRKLGTHSRTQAVARARELNLI
jgi:LuxR family maltose regulon positive regulatory protein